MDAYCMKCKTKREIRNPTQVTFKNGRPATQGTCSVCATKVFRIGRGEELPNRKRCFKRRGRVTVNRIYS